MGIRQVAIVIVVVGAVAFWMLKASRQEPATAVESVPVVAATPTSKAMATPVPGPLAKTAETAGPAATGQPRDESFKKLEVLKQILDSRNDNDPRLDTDFRDLDDATKRRLQEFYKELPLEKLNSRGTVVFLLGRNIRTVDDARFFNSVLRQVPCLSLAHCSEAGPSGPETDNDVTLAYPQIVATVGLVKSWGAISDPAAKAELFESLKAAAKSSNPALARAARASLSEIKR